MSIKRLSYVEYEGASREWSLEMLDFGLANLIVGRNATGKSRVINVITALMGVLSGQRSLEISDGYFFAEFEISDIEYCYELRHIGPKIIFEKLVVDEIVRLDRTVDGNGRIFYASEDRFLNFKIEETAIAIQSKRDKLQHPFIVALSDWAAASATYLFGSEFGRNNLMLASTGEEIFSQQTTPFPSKEDSSNPLTTYLQGFKMFGQEFDEAIVSDMREIGFPINSINAEALDTNYIRPSTRASLLTLSVNEDGIGHSISQILISQGMFRALALVIKLNWALFSERRGLLLIDDLGEGLDYARACKAIEVTLNKSQANGCQVIVTSNDRFVMNSVPLSNWIVLSRNGPKVHGFTARNSPKAFEEFKFSGLSNFDFFTTEAFH